jgi:DNA-binding NtrC family response regulator
MEHRILVVDDEPSILFAMTDYLERIGHKVDSAHGATEALILLAATRYAVVIADLRLSATQQSDGLDLLAHVRSRFPTARTILLTAYDGPETQQEALRLGVDALLSKSLDLSDVAAIVQRLTLQAAC